MFKSENQEYPDVMNDRATYVLQNFPRGAREERGASPDHPARNEPGIEEYRSRFASRLKAERYALRFEHGSRKRINTSERKALAGILSRLGRSGSILAVPCGAGRFLDLLDRHSDVVIEADVSAEMMAYSRERNRQLSGTCRFIQADASSLPLQDNSVDRVFCNRLLHHLESASERALVLKELYRIVRKDLIVSFFDYRSFGPLRQCLKRLKGRKSNYRNHPSRIEFFHEAERQGFRLQYVAPVGLPWNAEKYVVLAKDKPGN